MNTRVAFYNDLGLRTRYHLDVSFGEYSASCEGTGSKIILMAISDMSIDIGINSYYTTWSGTHHTIFSPRCAFAV